MDPNFQAQLSPLQQQQLMQEMEKMQMKDSLTCVIYHCHARDLDSNHGWILAPNDMITL